MKKSATSVPFATAMPRATATPQPPGMWKREIPKVANVRTRSSIHTIAYRPTCERCSTCSCSFSATLRSAIFAPLLDQVDEGEDEDPDEVDEVPVEPRELDRHVVLGRVGARAGLEPDDEQHRHADDDVDPMEAGDEEVERHEDRRPQQLDLLVRVVAAGELAHVEVVRVLDALQHEERDAEQEG